MRCFLILLKFMKSIERRFKKIAKANKNWTTYDCFAVAVYKQKFNEVIIGRWFNKLVDTEDYFNDEKKDVLRHLYNISKQP